MLTILNCIRVKSCDNVAGNRPCNTVARPKRKRAGRQRLPSHLPRIEHCHESDSCSCGTMREGFDQFR